MDRPAGRSGDFRPCGPDTAELDGKLHPPARARKRPAFRTTLDMASGNRGMDPLGW